MGFRKYFKTVISENNNFKEKHETELYNWTSDKSELKQWKKLVQEVEKNGSVADIISLIPRLNKDNFYDAPVYVPESNDLSIILRDLRFLKLVQKFNFFKGMKHCDFFKNLITWAVNDMDALNFVMPIAKNRCHSKLHKCAKNFINY